MRKIFKIVKTNSQQKQAENSGESSRKNNLGRNKPERGNSEGRKCGFWRC